MAKMFTFKNQKLFFLLISFFYSARNFSVTVGYAKLSFSGRGTKNCFFFNFSLNLLKENGVEPSPLKFKSSLGQEFLVLVVGEHGILFKAPFPRSSLSVSTKFLYKEDLKEIFTVCPTSQ